MNLAARAFLLCKQIAVRAERPRASSNVTLPTALWREAQAIASDPIATATLAAAAEEISPHTPPEESA